MKRLFICLTALCLTISTWAFDFQSGGIYYQITSSNQPYTVSVTNNQSLAASYAGTIEIPASIVHNGQTYAVTAIGEYAFSYSTSLTTVHIPSSVTHIEWASFTGCSSLTAVTIPNSVTTIENWAFSYCEALTTITIPASVQTIGEWAFAYCSALRTAAIPNSVKTIDKWAFAYCDALTTVTIPNSVTTIDEWAFSYCSALRTVTVPNSVTTIGAYAFRNCSLLTTASIGKSVTSIGNWAFEECSALTYINTYATTPPTLGIDVFAGVPVKSVRLFVPELGIYAYQTTEQWSDFIIGLPEQTAITEQYSHLPYTQQGNTLHFSQAQALSVYTIQGTHIYSGVTNVVELPQAGIYIITAANGYAKVMARE